MKIWYSVKDWWQNRGKLNDERFEDLNLDFQPASLSIQKRPPHPAAKLVARMLIGIFGFAVLWACIGHVDIHATAQGRVIPHSRIKVVQPLDLGKVTALHVAEGQNVKQGQILIEIDPTQISSEVKQLSSQLTDYQNRADGLSLLIKEVVKNTPKPNAATNIASKIESIPKNYHPWLNSQWQDYKQQKTLLIQQKRTQGHKLETSRALVTKYEKNLPIITDRALSLKTMHARNLVSKLEYLTVEQERIETEQELLAEGKRTESMASELQGIEEQIQGFQIRTLKEWQQQKLDYEQEALRISNQLAKAKDRLSKQTLYSPVNGVVKNLSITTIGAVVSPADDLMTIVPSDDQLQVEAFIENKDIGFVEEGQSVEVKMNTFNFTKYGLIKGEIIHISDDAIKQEGKEQNGYVFPAKIELNKDYLFFKGKKLKLQNGMEATVEVKTGKRRLIEFVMSPLLRHKAESLSER